MESPAKCSKEVLLGIVYLAYIAASMVMAEITPSGPCTPGPGFLMYVFLIPLNLAIFIYHLIKYRKSPSYWKCLLIDLLVWPAIILLSKCDLLFKHL